MHRQIFTELDSSMNEWHETGEPWARPPLQQQTALAEQPCVIPAVNLSPCRRAFRPRVATINRGSVKYQKSRPFLVKPCCIQLIETRCVRGVALHYWEQNEIEVVHEGIAVDVGKEPNRFMPHNRFDFRLDSSFRRVIGAPFRAGGVTQMLEPQNVPNSQRSAGRSDRRNCSP